MVFSFHFSHLLLGRQYGALLRVMLTIIVWVTVMLVPLLLLVWAQVQFLPYHDEMITWVQRVALLVDFLILWILWPMIMAGKGHVSAWWLRFFTTIPHAIRRLWAGLSMGVLVLLKMRPRFLLKVKWDELRIDADARGATALVFSTLLLIPFSLFVAVLPDMRMERWVVKRVPEAWVVYVPEGKRPETWKRQPMLSQTYTWFETPGALFHRNLHLKGQVLVAGKPSDATLVAFKNIRGLENLAGRDLRYADLSFSYLPKAVLSEAR